MLNLNGAEIEAEQELDNLQACSDAENFIQTCFRPRYADKKLVQSRLGNLVCSTDHMTRIHTNNRYFYGTTRKIYTKCSLIDIKAFDTIWKRESDQQQNLSLHMITANIGGTTIV